MARIAWIDDNDASGEIADVYRELKKTSPTGNVPDILRTMSLRPDFLRAIDQASRLHFTDGALTRAEHEMIASYVSARSTVATIDSAAMPGSCSCRVSSTRNPQRPCAMAISTPPGSRPSTGCC